MRTLIVSDLHLGSVSRSDVLRRPELRAPLLGALAEIDRLVLLGDVLELRHGPPREAMAAARGFFEDLGRALAGRELVVIGGNHDHALFEPWLARRAEEERSAALGVQALMQPAQASPMLARLADWASPARVVAAYPGMWLRPDVFAMHGHYLDCHLTVPTLERLSLAVMSRVLGRPTDAFDSVEDYEAIGSPVFAWRDAVARDAVPGGALNGMATVAAWRALDERRSRSGRRSGGRERSERHRRGPGRRARTVARLRRRALVGAFPLAVATLNRAGLGPLRADVSGAELRRAGLRAMGDVTERLGIGDAYVVFGHTHRAGPLPGDPEQEWRGGPAPRASARAAGRACGGTQPMPDGARLVNCGCWAYAPVFLTAAPGESPYWPGTCVLLEDSGPPALLHLLADRTHSELRPTPA